MGTALNLTPPRHVPVLDPGFRSPALATRDFATRVTSAGGTPLVLALEGVAGRVSRYETMLLPADHPDAEDNLFFTERLLKFLLWQRGGYKLYIAGPDRVVDHLTATYSPTGARAFDAHFWGQLIHEKPFCVVPVPSGDVPDSTPLDSTRIARDWQGWRIGFDLGASDRKVAAVKDGRLALLPDGTPVLSDEFLWDPKPQTSPQYHFDHIMEILRLAETRIREVDPGATIAGIGGSAAGVYLDGRVRVASLFRGIEPRDRFEKEIAPLFERIREAWGNIPFRLENDGDVTALAGAIALNAGGILGLAMGSSLAAGYVDDDGQILGWMNELAFVPVDYSPTAPVDEWSGDRGVGANYFSQQAVARLIPVADLESEMQAIPADALPARLARVQERMAAGDLRARQIYQTIGCCFGYTVAHFCDFYSPVNHLEVLGRVMTGEGGQLILAEARRILEDEFPDIAQKTTFYEPDEREKRHGQAAAAAYLPTT